MGGSSGGRIAVYEGRRHRSLSFKFPIESRARLAGLPFESIGEFLIAEHTF